jgi:SAM-dependent methyltransferase
MRRAVSELVKTGGVDLRGAEVLEIGPGTGFWVDLWQESGASVTGLDITDTAVARLGQRFPDQRFRTGDVSEDGLDLGRFDVVSAQSVLLHIVDESRLETALANVARMLLPGGALLLMEPLVEHAWWGPPVTATSNSRARTVQQWRIALAGAGLELVTYRPVTALLANVCDTRHRATWRLHMAYWWLVRRWLTRVPRLAPATLRALVVLDGLLLRLGIAPSAKVMLVRHRAGSAPA